MKKIWCWFVTGLFILSPTFTAYGVNPKIVTVNGDRQLATYYEDVVNHTFMTDSCAIETQVQGIQAWGGGTSYIRRGDFNGTFLLATSIVASAQFAPSKENLRGLTGVRLIVMFGNCPSRDLSDCAKGLDEARRPQVLRMLEADVTAKLQNAGIPLFGLADERSSKAGGPKLIVLVTLDKLNGFVYPIVTEVKLLQMARLVRDPSIELNAVTWSRYGVGGPELEIEKVRNLTASLIDQFIEAYRSENPKQSVSSGADKSKDSKR